MFMMVKADDTYVKVKITGESKGYFQVNHREWIPRGNFIMLDEFVREKALKLIENAPTNRALDIPRDILNKISGEHLYNYAIRAVMKYYGISALDLL